MRRKRFATCLSLTLGLPLLFLACDPAKKTNEKTATETSANDVANNGGESDLKISNPTISSMVYRAETHSILFHLEYSGCAATKHVFKLDGICAESYPMQCAGKLYVPKDFNASCKMMIREELLANLEDGFDTSYVSVLNADGKATSVLVDRNGKIPAN